MSMKNNGHEEELERHDVTLVTLWDNIRTSIKPESITEMALTILEHGVLQPPLARLRDGVPQIYAGQRRYYGLLQAISLAETQGLPAHQARFASRAEELKELPLIIRERSDGKILEEQIVENLQREEVSPREEAVGYARLLEMADEAGAKLYTMEKLAATVGKDFRYISDRLKLRHAPETMWQAFERNEIGTSLLELVGGIPTAKQRESAAKMILKPRYSDKPMTVKEADELIQKEFRVSLRSPGFALDDAELLPPEVDEDGVRIKGGACSDCPHRTGNMPELAGRLAKVKQGNQGSGSTSGVDPNVCCNPACFAEKQNLVWRKTKESAEREGRRVMDVDASSKVFDEYSGRPAHSCGFVDLADEPGHAATGHYGGDDLDPWEKLLKGTDAKKQAVMARHPRTKKLHWLLELETAIDLATANGHGQLFKERPKPVTSADRKRDAAKAARQRAKEQRGCRVGAIKEKLFLEALQEKLRGAPQVDPAAGALLLSPVIELASYDGLPRPFAALLGLGEEELNNASDDEIAEALDRRMRQDARTHAHAWLGWLAPLLLATEHDMKGYGREFFELASVKGFAKLLKIDEKKLTTMAETAVEAAEKREDEGRAALEAERTGKVKGAEEELHACPKCGQENFTAQGLKSHNCAKRMATKKAKPAKTVKPSKPAKKVKAKK